MSNSFRPHGLQHARLPCPSPTPQACSNSCPSSQWYHPTISSSVFWTLLNFTLVYWTLLCAKYSNILLQLFLIGVPTQIVPCHRGSKRQVWKLNSHLFDAKVLTHILFYFFNLHPVSLVVWSLLSTTLSACLLPRAHHTWSSGWVCFVLGSNNNTAWKGDSWMTGQWRQVAKMRRGEYVFLFVPSQA